MGKKRKPRYWISALVFTALWPITCVGFELDPVGALIAAGVYVLAGIGVSSIISKRRAKKEAAAAAEAAKAEAERREAEAKAKEAKSPYSPEVQAIIREGRLAMKEMGRLYSSIQNPDVRSRINELMSVSDKIVRDAIDDPSDVPQIRKFLDYYLPTTIKLLNTYDRMSAQEVSGENISGSMERIEDMLDTAIEAYKKQLDALFANQAADIQMDIEIMNGMLAREGLGGKSYLDINSFMKQYEKQQQYAKQNNINTNIEKGSTSNG
jgi:5-bromo-4-chloroindolyl phosphate hydrolysis protein